MSGSVTAVSRRVASLQVDGPGSGVPATFSGSRFVLFFLANRYSIRPARLILDLKFRADSDKSALSEHKPVCYREEINLRAKLGYRGGSLC